MLSKTKYLFWLIIIHLLIRTSCVISVCTPSSCGKIRNISHPFRLKGDPKHCGNHDYELVCENNTTTSLFFLSHKYTVQAINYSNYTIRLTDASINSNDNCSFPNHSLSRSDFPDHEYPYGTETYRRSMSESRRDITGSVTIMSCPYPVNNSLLLEISTPCADRNYGFNKTHRYVKFGELNGSYVKEMCTIELMTMTSSPLNEEESVSLSEIHSSLLYGFELSWFIALCERHCVNCWFDGKQTMCEYSCSIGFWEIPCGGMPFWFSFAVSGITWIIELAIGQFLMTS
ncbi:hypothetical protein C2S53_015635 [Perilla frutescens var. hirtella]|uniref:Wall-associated receptor kinase galacturonan-binding domain-containing protein n=1 Tax=Perilla frutescens var. hirtella TaxID=608512 RepID=A0AAD4PEW0_PERFH|nr:hypothetical protein C2S53_015635 [Perilla frutescens var. hirtella]